MNYERAELADKLAAEYVLGTLRGPARARFEQLLPNSPTLRAAVNAWEQHLLPLADAAPAIEPPARVWTGIVDKTGIAQALYGSIPTQPAERAAKQTWLQSITFWRPVGLASSLLAIALMFYVGLAKPPVSEPDVAQLMAVLSGADKQPVMVLAQQASGDIVVTVVGGKVSDAGKDYELWALPTGGAPKSLGLVAQSGVTRLKASSIGLKLIPTVAISLEPRGGSTTGAPTGPVLFTGSVVAVARS